MFPLRTLAPPVTPPIRPARRDRTEAALVTESLGQRFGPIAALEDVTLAVGAREVVCVLGASGSGKSTLLRLIAGVARPTTGRVILNGAEVAGPQTFVEPEHRHVGMVFQDFALFPHLTVRANVAFGVKGRRQSEVAAIVDSLLEQVDLTRYAQSYPHMLSGGERQRVALARALAPEPQLLLMDEPFSSLDGRLRDQVRQQTLELLRDIGTTTIIVTHEPDEALHIADRIVILDKGRLVESGTPEELYTRPATIFAARLFGHLNEVPGTCRNGSISTPLGTFEATHVAEYGAGSVFIRPHHLRLAASSSSIRARVIRTTFLGEVDHVLLEVAGLESPVALRAAGRTRLAPDEIVHLDIHRDAVFVLAHDNQSPPRATAQIDRTASGDEPSFPGRESMAKPR
jgi:iron(III) transport system ATP-binding protein